MHAKVFYYRHPTADSGAIFLGTIKPKLYELDEVGEIDTPAFDAPTALEWIFQNLQNIEGRPTVQKMLDAPEPLRSLSCGDVIEIEGRIYWCAMVGWETI